MHWKVKLEGDENTLTKLASGGNANAKVSRDGVDWFLESTDFEMISEHTDVKTKAASILSAMGAKVAMGPIYRMHYDNSKTVYRD